MTHKTLCRVCAADNVIMYSIADTELQEVYEKLTNISLHADSRPLTVCYNCHSQLQTTRKLLLKALKVEEILVPILTGQVQLSNLDRQALKLSSSLSVSHTGNMSTELPLFSTVIKEEPPDESMVGGDQQEPTWGETYIKLEPVSGNPSNELISEGDATYSNPTGVPERRLTRHQETCAGEEIFIKIEPVSENPDKDPNYEGDATQSYPTGVPERKLTRHQETCAIKDARISMIKKEPLCDHHGSLWKADSEGDALKSYDIDFVVRRETRNVATYARKRKVFIKIEPMSDNPSNEPNYKGDATQSNPTGVPERRLITHQETCAEKDAGISIIKEEPVCDHHGSIWEADPAGDALQSYDIEFVVPRETTDVATNARKRKAAPLEQKPKLHQPENAIRIKPPEMLQQPEIAGTSAHNEATHLNVPKTKIVTKKKSKIDLKRNKYICNDCNRLFNSKTILLKHIRRHVLLKVSNKPINKLTGNLKNKWYACHMCDYKSKHTGTLKGHIRTHTGEKPNACHMCNFKCNNKCSLIAHLRTHTGEKPYACHLCDYKASQVGRIKAHLKTHTDEKPFACNLCDYKCNYNNSLKVHMRTHTGEKPYACHLCDCKFKTNSNLRHHIRTHTGEKPHTCHLCDHKFKKLDSLRKHIKRLHTD